MDVKLSQQHDLITGGSKSMATAYEPRDMRTNTILFSSIVTVELCDRDSSSHQWRCDAYCGGLSRIVALQWSRSSPL